MSADFVKVVNLKESLHAADLELRAAKRSVRTAREKLELEKRLKTSPLAIERAEHAYRAALLQVELCEKQHVECGRRLLAEGRWT
jgi:hypothetical protein